MRLEDVPLEVTRAPEPPAPPISDLWRGRARGWLRYHVQDRAEGWSQLAFARLVAPLPPEAPAALGRALGAITARIDEGRPFVGHMRRAIAIIRPDLDEAGREALLASWWRNVGMTHALFPALDAIARPGRFTVHGKDKLAAADADPRPTMYLLVHLGNWELLRNVAVDHVSRPSFGIYEPQPNRFQNRLVFEGRSAKGMRVFPPSRTLPKMMLGLMRGGCNPALFIDEVSDGRCKFPLWGRELPSRSNVVTFLHLAHRTGARVQPAHFLRDAPGRASLHVLETIEPSPDQPRDAYVAETALRLNAIFEPVIAANLDQWYMLKDMRVAPGATTPLA